MKVNDLRLKNSIIDDKSLRIFHAIILKKALLLKHILSSEFSNSMKPQIILLGALTTLTLGSIAAPSYAISLIDNVPASNDNLSSTISASANTAVSFTIPAGNTDYILNTVILRLGGYAPTGNTPVLTIRQGGVLNPSSSVVANFTNPAGLPGTAIRAYTFTPTTSFTCLANTRYWLYLSASAGNFTWRASDNAATNTPSGIATFGAYRQTINGGTSFSAGTNFNTFAVDATAVPWETSDAVLPLSIIGFGLVAGGKRFLALKKSQKS
jgi:hypothetical protein